MIDFGMGQPVKLTEAETNQWIALIYKESGIDLGRGKAYLIESRLIPLLRRFEVSSISEFYKLAIADVHKGIMGEIISAISTHETYFFREKPVFDLLKSKIIPKLLESNSRLRIWSAACSSGQETYSISMICKELPVPHSKKNIHIFGTDICGKSIETARNGIYSNFELQRGLDELRIKKFFTIDKFGNRVCDSLRSLVEFRVSNLFDRSQGLGGSFDLVLCRNVAIYFSGEKKIELYKNLATALRRGGILVLGVTESMVDLPGLFRTEVLDNCSFYVRV